MAIAAALVLFAVAVSSARDKRADDFETGQSPDTGFGITIETESLSQLGIPGLNRFDSFGPVRGSARVSAQDDHLRLDDLRVQIDARDGRLDIEGTVADASRWRGIDLAFRLSAPSARWLTTGDADPGPGPMTVRGRLAGDRTSLRITELVLATPSSQVTGSLDLKQGQNGFRLDGRLDATALNVDEFLQREHAKASPDDRSFSEQPLPLDSIRGLQADLVLNAKRMTLHGLTLDDVETSMKADASGTGVHSIGSHAGGRYDVALTLTPADRFASSSRP